jgi:hypothetical protein
VNKWEGLVELAKAFDAKRNPKTAFCVVVAVRALPLIATGATLLLLR